MRSKHHSQALFGADFGLLRACEWGGFGQCVFAVPYFSQGFGTMPAALGHFGLGRFGTVHCRKVGLGMVFWAIGPRHDLCVKGCWTKLLWGRVGPF